MPKTTTHQDNTLTITGTVQRVHFSSDKFSAGSLRIIGGADARETIAYKAKFPTETNATLTMRGAWVDDPKWGRQFSADSLVYDAPMTSAGLAHYLATNPAFFGIGPVKAHQIAQQFAENFDEMIREDPGAIMRAVRLTAQQIETLQREWIATSDRNKLCTWLGQFELTPCQMNNLIEAYGVDRVRAVLESDPYLLCREVRGYGFARTDGIAMKMGVAKDHPGRIRACISDLLYRITDDGHTWIEARELLRLAEGSLAVDTIAQRDALRAMLREMCTSGAVAWENDGNTTRLASPAMFKAEEYLRDAFARARALPQEDIPYQRYRAMMDMLPDLTDSQERALRMAIDSRISLIAGEAGTGKSYTIDAIRQAFLMLGKTVYLAAPTGKAAKRIEEVMRGEAQAKTIHRLLNYNPSGDPTEWGYNEDNKLPCDVVILDECGMVDVLLAQHVFEAVDLARTQVILVGDHQQLPPVGAGNLLRDLLAAEGRTVPFVILDQVMRQAGILKENCVAILHGRVPDTAPGEAGKLRPWYRIAKGDDPAEILATLLQIVEHELPKIGMGELENWQVLTPQHATAIGVAALNLHLQRLWQRVKYGIDLPEVPTDVKRLPRPQFMAGDRVMQTRNNYQLEVMNGAQGTIVEANVERETLDKNGEPTGKFAKGHLVDFGDRDAAAPLFIGGDDLSDLQLAYAMTVHKSQGSEYPAAVVICARANSFMLSRNLLYTAVTRARKTCVLIGDHVAFQRAVKNISNLDRRTWLSVWGGKNDERF